MFARPASVRAACPSADVTRWIASLILTLGLAFLTAASPASAQGSAAHETARRMGRGVNVLGYDGIWNGGVDAPFRERYFKMLYDAGFRHVRINLHAFQYMDKEHRVDAKVLDKLDWVFGQAIAAGLIPVVDEHDFADCQRDPATCATRLKAFWTQLSVRYAGRYPSVVFEILNEPGGGMSLETWNTLLAETIAIVRLLNPERTIIAAALNVEAPIANRMPRLPERDSNIIVTVHYYQPMAFTHQGAPWSSEHKNRTGVPWGSRADEAQAAADLEEVAAWAKAERRPIYLGEFGVYDRAPIAARARYAGFLARTAERLGWPWAYWQFGHDFALYDTDRERWVGPLLKALVPPTPRPRP